MSKREASTEKEKKWGGMILKIQKAKLNSLETSQKNKVLSVKSKEGIVETENVTMPTSDSGLWLTRGIHSSVRIWVSNLFCQ